MRIAIFTNTYWPTVNGVAVSAKNLHDGLVKLGHEVYVFAPAVEDMDESKDDKNVLRYPSFAIKAIASYELALPIAPKIKKVLESKKFDIIHTEHPLWIGKWGRSYAKKHDLPIVTTVHTQYDLYAKLIPLPQEILVPILKKQLNEYLNSVDLVTTPGSGSAERLKRQGVETPIMVVSNPTDLQEFWKASGDKIRAKLGVGVNDKLIGFVGRLSQEKNIEVLLRAVGEVLRRIPNAKMVLIGDGPDREKLQAKAAEISDRIIFAGKVDHSEMPEYYAAFDLFMSASMSEVQPMTFAESMAASAPVLVFDVAGCNDMVENGENGILVDKVHGAKGLSEAAIKLLQNEKELAEMKKRAKKWAERYDSSSATISMVDAYKQAIRLHRND